MEQTRGIQRGLHEVCEVAMAVVGPLVCVCFWVFYSAIFANVTCAGGYCHATNNRELSEMGTT
jgi:hypothetical protein